MAYFPVFVAMTGRRCVVVGGGAVAQGKVQALLEAGARVTIVSPTLTPSLACLAADGRVGHRAREFRSGDLEGAEIAFSAAGDDRVTAAVVAEARQRGIWVNAADDPDRCDFILPSVLRRGALTVAVGTGGASPALARAIREELEEYFGEEYAALVDVVAEVRRELRRGACSPDASAWRRALDAELRRLVAEGQREEARARLLGQLDARRGRLTGAPRRARRLGDATCP